MFSIEETQESVSLGRILDFRPGELAEPLTGRRWDRQAIEREWIHRVDFFQRQGLTRGDCVFLHHGNCLEFFADLLAIWTVGAYAVPIDARLTAFEVATLAGAATPKLSLWLESGHSEAIAELTTLGVRVLQTPGPAHGNAANSARIVPRTVLQPDEPALILFTSGSTGQPKGVVHTHRSLRAQVASLRICLGTQKFRRTLCLLPTHFGHGLICNCLFPWLSGQDLFIVPPFKADLLLQLGTLLDEHRITCLSSVPSMWRLALRTARPPRLGSLERVLCGSAPLSASLWRGIIDWTGAPDVINAYGITETASWVAGTTVDGVTPDDGLIGVPWGAEIKILDGSSTDRPPDFRSERVHGESGYVWLKTPALMKGYLGRDDLTQRVVAQGWFSTGDIGVIDERGLLYLRGRERDEINKGGMKVYPGDVDMVAEQFEKTVDVCTFAYGDPFYGENIGMAVVLKSANDDDIRCLYERLNQRLAKFQMPQRWYLLSEIPRTARGKVNRAKLAETCAPLEPLDLRRIVFGEAEGRTA